MSSDDDVDARNGDPADGAGGDRSVGEHAAGAHPFQPSGGLPAHAERVA